jgi:hypothetical protein
VKSWLIIVICLLSLAGTRAMAQTCPAGPPDKRLALNTIQAAVLNKYVCVGASPNATWNELHSGSSGGSVIDYKLGPTSPTDPTATVGTYAITSIGKDGVITYNYTGGGGTYSYYVQPTGTGQYYFCPTSGGTVITVNIQASHC